MNHYTSTDFIQPKRENKPGPLPLPSVSNKDDWALDPNSVLYYFDGANWMQSPEQPGDVTDDGEFYLDDQDGLMFMSNKDMEMVDELLYRAELERAERVSQDTRKKFRQLGPELQGIFNTIVTNSTGQYNESQVLVLGEDSVGVPSVEELQTLAQLSNISPLLLTLRQQMVTHCMDNGISFGVIIGEMTGDVVQ